MSILIIHNTNLDQFNHGTVENMHTYAKKIPSLEHVYLIGIHGDDGIGVLEQLDKVYGYRTVPITFTQRIPEFKSTDRVIKHYVRHT